MLQVATTLILILAANTSFADFPANFQRRCLLATASPTGHRLVFSNGVIGLAIASTALVVLFRADVHGRSRCTRSGCSPRSRCRRRGWRAAPPPPRARMAHGLFINGLGAITTAVVTVVIAVTKFVDGAWAGDGVRPGRYGSSCA